MSPKSNRRENLIIDILLLLPIFASFLIVFLAILEPFLEFKGCIIAERVFRALHYICHQAPSACIWFGNYPMALCSRCFSLYFAILISGIWMYNKKQKKINFLFSLALILPMVIDGLFQWFGFRRSNNIIRIFTGALGGFGLSLIIYPIYFKFCFSLERFIFGERR